MFDFRDFSNLALNYFSSNKGIFYIKFWHELSYFEIYSNFRILLER